VASIAATSVVPDHSSINRNATASSVGPRKTPPNPKPTKDPGKSANPPNFCNGRPPDRPGPKGSWPDLAIRDGDWKLLVFRNGSRAELFNLASDRGEATNVADKHPKIVQRLSKQVIEWDRSIAGEAKVK